jgi:undecaprenyl-diphosphatase
MYLGAHFPLDIVGGWALGALIGGSASLIFGISSKSISVIKLKKFLNTKGLNIQHLTFAEVDARGSRPISITTYDGKEYFGKIFGKQEHAADWLFKIFRFFRYKNLQAEEPHFNSRRNVEIEAFAMLWAKQAGVRVANVTNIQKYGSYWLLIQEKINAIPLSEHGHILQKSLVDTWVQVKKLHTANIAHRDLRASNIMIDKKGRALIIDYGFTEISASAKRQHMDNAELLMSMSLVVGVDRTVAAAKKGIGKKQLALALPYLQTAVFSGPTTKLLKGNKGLLADLKNRITDELDIKEEVDEANILRINRRKAINLVLLAIFVYVVAPQFGVFKDSVATTEIKEPLWLLPLAISSISTYFFTGIIYSALAPVPLKIRDSSLVQLAASFVSKVLPGGLGSTTLNAKYMVKAGMDAIETSTVISAQALIGFIMFIVPLSLLLALNGANILKLVHIDVNPKVAIIVALSGAMGAATVLILPKFRTIAVSKLTSALESIRNISVAPRELTVASIASLAVTAAYVFCLYAALQSVGANIGISTAIIVYATAIIAKSAVPTPGGLGPVEAAMIATLITFGLDKGSAVSAVLIYRLGTFWIPIPLSLLAYRIIGRLKLI